MKSSVVIKSFQNGISLHLDDELSFEELLGEISLKFRESAGFFKNAKMALSFEGRELSEEEEKIVAETITASSDINIVCLVGKDNNTNQNYLKALQMFNHDNGNEGQFYRGTLKKGQVLETESSIVIIGDVNPGATIISIRDIIILGGLYGEAYAGADGSDGHFVVALEMSPEKLTIGDFKYRAKDKSSRWSIKLKIQPKIAYVKTETIVIEPITKELLSGIPL
ncbi:MAG: septum site-determining protein MinC [Lachnospiraceae bacterium]|nr:septum site-determining protein MinC [Lachnospiraceae bacterium]